MACGCGGACGCGSSETASAQALEFSARPPSELSARIEALEAAVVAIGRVEFYSDDEERDDHGRWTSGGGGGAAQTTRDGHGRWDSHSPAADKKTAEIKHWLDKADALTAQGDHAGAKVARGVVEDMIRGVKQKGWNTLSAETAAEEFRFFSKAEREQDAKSGDALPNGSFPIEDEDDLKNAIRLVGMAKNPGLAKSHIRARASTLGLESKIPKDW